MALHASTFKIKVASSMKMVGNHFKDSHQYKNSSKYKDSVVDHTVEKLRVRRHTIAFLKEPNYDLKPSSTMYFREDLGGISCVKFVPNEEDTVVVGFYSGDLKICKPKLLGHQQGDPQTLVKGWEGNYPLSCLKFHPQEQEVLYASSHNGTISVIRIPKEGHTTNTEVCITENDNEINSFDLDLNGSKIVTGGRDATLRVYDTENHKLVLTYERRSTLTAMSVSTYHSLSGISLTQSLPEWGHEQRIYCVRCHLEESSVFLSGGWDKSIKIWDTRVKDTYVRSIPGPYIYGESIDINRGRMLTGSCVLKDSLKLWDLERLGELITNVVPTNKPAYLYGEYPYTAQFFKGDPSGNLIMCGGSGLGGLQVINIQEEAIQYLIEDDRPIVAADSTADSKIVFGGISNILYFVNLKEGSQSTYPYPSFPNFERDSVIFEEQV